MTSSSTPSPKDQWTAEVMGAGLIVEARAWLQRCSNLESGYLVGRMLSRITADRAAFEEIAEKAFRAQQPYSDRKSATKEIGVIAIARLANGIGGEEVGK